MPGWHRRHAARFLAGLSVLPALAQSAPGPRPEAAWAPLSVQVAMAGVEAHGREHADHPEFRPGQSRAEAKARIRAALEGARAKGIGVADIQFMMASSLLEDEYAADYGGRPSPPPGWDKVPRCVAHSNEWWLEEVDAFNARNPKQPLEVRLRLNVTSLFLYHFFRTLKPYKTRLEKEDFGRGVTRSRHKDLPLDPCGGARRWDDPCFEASPVPRGYYRARNEDGTFNEVVPNLANPAVRRGIAEWTRSLIDAALALAPRTRIQEVSLSLDAGMESSLFPSDSAQVVSFSDRAYRPGEPFPEKWAFFQGREKHLKETYTLFAEAVHSRRNRDGSGIRAGIFQQAWSLDGRARGTFDLYALLKGAGVDVLHHTQMPLGSAHSLMAVAFSASIASALGIPFDTEFSWAHFGVPGSRRNGMLALPDVNAGLFHEQAVAGLRYGAAGITYANWTIGEILEPPATPAWSRIIGGSPRAGAGHLDALAAGVKSLKPLAPPKRAIYVSAMGRMECEEKRRHPELKGRPCDLASYFRWFEEAGISRAGKPANPLATERVTILTDGMIRDGKADFRGLTEIFIPAETSGATHPAVRAALAALAPDQKRKFRWARPGRAAAGSFEEWMAATR